MNVMLVLILASLFMAFVFLGAFIWAVRSGQFDDTETPSMRILMDDGTQETSNSTTKTNRK